MATGVGYVLKTLVPRVEVICVQPVGAPAMTRSWHERRVVTTDSTDTIADGVAGRCPIPAVLDDLIEVADDAVLVGGAGLGLLLGGLLEADDAVLVGGAGLGLLLGRLLLEADRALWIRALLRRRASRKN